MPRTDPRMVNESRIQPGRVMILLRDPLIMDDVVMQIAKQYGYIKGLHRPSSNPQLIFVQYQNDECTAEAIEKLRNYPIFLNVDLAVKSEKYQHEHENNGGNNARNLGGGKQKMNNRQNQRPNDSNLNMSNGNNNNNNNSMKDSSYHQMDNDSSLNNFYQPEIPLGCWYCTKMPSFECQCGAYYCDTNCQRLDWDKHRSICMPRLVPISYSNKRMLQEATASKQNSSLSGSSYASPSQELNSSQSHQIPRKVGNETSSPGKQQQQQNQRRNAQNNQKKNQSDQGNKSTQNKLDNSNNQKSPTAQNSQKNASSPEDSGKLNQLGNKLQRLKLAKSAKEGILQPGPFPRTGSRVKISASLASGVVYIYHENSKPGEPSDYLKLANRVYQASKDAQPVDSIPKMDDVIFAPFMGEYYRAKVLQVKGDQLEIQYPDFGNMATISWQQARQIADDDLKWTKYLTMPAMLEGVGTLTGEMKKLLDSFEEIVEFELLKATDMEDSDMKDIVLKRPKETTTLNVELIELKEKEQRQREEKKSQDRRDKEDQQKKAETEQSAKIADPNNYEPVLFDESIESKQLPLDSKQKLMIIDASDLLETRLISVIGCGYIEEYGAVVQDCGTLGPLDPNPYKPTQEGEVCLVLHENDWTRALYDISEGNFMLLDVGILASVPTANVRRFPPGLSRIVYNNEVIVENLAVLKAMMINGKSDSIHGKAIEAWVSASDDGVCIRIVP
ncbi:bromodomain-containing protein DDB_G0270170-like [Malaya genurostris]|uniref:bromodomain-containing protein DDB_G0270170-like n=1 Tax=Malaya genurostris TaxID=325434 RepID=UPI0026F3EB93|nr:bromodomain-containing protein DDB_G0270170-like [Malaya genurostris]